MIRMLSDTEAETLEFFRVMYAGGIAGDGDRVYKGGYVYTLNRGQVSKCKNGIIKYLGSVK